MDKAVGLLLVGKLLNFYWFNLIIVHEKIYRPMYNYIKTGNFVEKVSS